MPQLCSFSYTAFTLAFIYLVLFFLVCRYLLNLTRQGSSKKKAQKLFLFILIGQTLLRVIYFILFPLLSDSATCEPTMSGDRGEKVSSASWWIHLLSNIPAAMFLMAFSVLVYTFARIYHKVLLAGVWFQERRFRILTVVLVLLNVVALIAIFGDWAYAATDQKTRLASFVDMLLYCILSVSAILAFFFLAYGNLLYYQVQAIIRASSENVASGGGGGMTHPSSTFREYGGEQSVSRENMYGSQRYNSNPGQPRTPGRPTSVLLPSAIVGDGHVMDLPQTGFTPVHAQHAQRGPNGSNGSMRNGNPDSHSGSSSDDGEGEPGAEGRQQPATKYRPPPFGGINQPAGATANAGGNTAGSSNERRTGLGSPPSVSTNTTAAYPISGFASPNLPIRGGGDREQVTVVAHSYVSDSVMSSGSYSPEAIVGLAVAKADLMALVPAVGPDGQLLPANASSIMGGARPVLEPVALGQPRISGSGYASSVSPEYAQLPNSALAHSRGHAGGSNQARRGSPIAGGGTQGSAGTGTPTDQLVGSMSDYHPLPSPARRVGTSSLSRNTTHAAAAAVAVPQYPIITSPGSSRALSHSPPEPDTYQPHNGVGQQDILDETLERSRNGAAGGGGRAMNGATKEDRERARRGLTNGTSLPPYGFPGEGAHQYVGGGAGPNGKYSSEYEASQQGNSYSHSQPLLDSTSSASAAPMPPNPMRKIAFIAAICTVCLLLRTILIITFASLHQDFNWYMTLFYFALSEIIPLLAMLKVFNTPTPLVHVLGHGTGTGGGGF